MNRIGYLLFGFFLLNGLFVQGAISDQVKIMPVLTLIQSYNDNILFSRNPDDDFVTTISGRLQIKKKTQRLDARLDARLDKVRYQELSEYNSLDKFLSGSVDFKASERMALGGRAGYVQDAQRDSKLDTSGLMVVGDRQTKTVSLSGSYLFTEKTMGDINMGFEQETIQKYPDTEDNKTAFARMTLSKDLSPTFRQTTGLFSMSYLNSISDENTYFGNDMETHHLFRNYTSDIFQIYTGFSRNITECYTLYLQAGAGLSRTREEAKTVLRYHGLNTSLSSQVYLENDTVSGVFFTGLNYSGERSEARIDVSHDIRQGAGTNGAVNRSSITAGFEQKVTDHFSTTLQASCYLNKNKRATSRDIDLLTLNIQPGFQYKFTNDWTLFGLYKVTFIEDRQDNTSSKRNLIYIGITKTFDNLFY